MTRFFVPALDFGGFALDASVALSTMVTAQTASGSWANRYWKSNEQVVNNGDYVEFIITELGYGTGFGLGTSGVAPTGDLQGQEYMLWPFNQGSGQMAILLNAGLAAWATISTWNITDRFRFTKSGSDLVVTCNGVTIYTFVGAATQPLYVQAASHDGSGSVAVDSVNGQAVTTKLALNMTYVDGVPTKDVYANSSSLYFSRFNWLTDSLVKRKEGNQPGSYFKFRFTGGNCAIPIDLSLLRTSSLDTTVAYRIDNGTWQYFTPSTGRESLLQIASGLHVGTHTAEVMISASQYGRRYNATQSQRTASIFFWGVRVPASVTNVAAPTVHPNEAVFFADSNGEGAEALAAYYENGNLAFPKLIADACNLEFSARTIPGSGWVTSPGGGETYKLPNYYDTANDTSAIDYDAVDEPDYVFIIHGQNDGTADLLVGTTIADMLVAFPSAIIFVCCPVSQHRRADLEAAVDAIANPRVMYLDNTINCGALYPAMPANNGVHIDQAGHVAYALEIKTEFLAALLPPVDPGVDTYFRPGGVDQYHRPGGVDIYSRPIV